MAKILITGHTGFIGSYLFENLSSIHDCFGVSRSTDTDIANYESLLQINFNPDIIIHTAASINNDFETCFNSNIVGIHNICKYAVEKNVKYIILLSSIFIYDMPENEYYGVYGKTKRISEDIAIEMCKNNNIDLTILRLSQVYDKKGVAKKSQPFLYTLIDNIHKNKQFDIYGKKNPLRNFIDIEYLVQIVMEVLSKKKTGIYNIINERSHTIIELAFMIFNQLNIEAKINYDENKENIKSIYIPNTGLLKTTLRPKILHQGIKEIIEYENRKNL